MSCQVKSCEAYGERSVVCKCGATAHIECIKRTMRCPKCGAEIEMIFDNKSLRQDIKDCCYMAKCIVIYPVPWLIYLAFNIFILTGTIPATIISVTGDNGKFCSMNCLENIVPLAVQILLYIDFTINIIYIIVCVVRVWISDERSPIAKKLLVKMNEGQFLAWWISNICITVFLIISHIIGTLLTATFSNYLVWSSNFLTLVIGVDVIITAVICQSIVQGIVRCFWARYSTVPEITPEKPVAEAVPTPDGV